MDKKRRIKLKERKTRPWVFLSVHSTTARGEESGGQTSSILIMPPTQKLPVYLKNTPELRSVLVCFLYQVDVDTKNKVRDSLYPKLEELAPDSTCF